MEAYKDGWLLTMAADEAYKAPLFWSYLRKKYTATIVKNPEKR